MDRRVRFVQDDGRTDSVGSARNQTRIRQEAAARQRAMPKLRLAPVPRAPRTSNLVRRIKRIIQIAELLQRGRATDFQSIARRIGVGRRTLFRDLAILRDLGMGFAWCPVRRRYVIDSLQFQLSRSLSADEAAAFVSWSNGGAIGRSHSSAAFAGGIEKIADILDREFRSQTAYQELINAAPRRATCSGSRC